MTEEDDILRDVANDEPCEKYYLNIFGLPDGVSDELIREHYKGIDISNILWPTRESVDLEFSSKDLLIKAIDRGTGVLNEEPFYMRSSHFYMRNVGRRGGRGGRVGRGGGGRSRGGYGWKDSEGSPSMRGGYEDRDRDRGDRDRGDRDGHRRGSSDYGSFRGRGARDGQDDGDRYLTRGKNNDDGEGNKRDGDEKEDFGSPEFNPSPMMPKKKEEEFLSPGGDNSGGGLKFRGRGKKQFTRQPYSWRSPASAVRRMELAQSAN